MTTTARAHRATTNGAHGMGNGSARVRYDAAYVSPFVAAFREAVRKLPPSGRFGRREQILHKSDNLAASFEAMLDEAIARGADEAVIVGLLSDLYEAGRRKLLDVATITDPEFEAALQREQEAENAGNIAEIRANRNANSTGALRALIDAIDREMAAEAELRRVAFAKLWALEHPEEAA